MGRWVFGYGSLMWRQEFPFVERRAAFVEGYRRVFWQGSTDHRGVPGAPGRVVTLAPHEGARTWGEAFLVAPEHEEEVVTQLDHREQGGYRRVRAELIGRDGGVFAEATIYLASPDNETYLGRAPLSVIAEQVVAARGPSGANSEYVLELAAALRRIGADDRHVFRLERLVRERLPRPM